MGNLVSQSAGRPQPPRQPEEEKPLLRPDGRQKNPGENATRCPNAKRKKIRLWGKKHEKHGKPAVLDAVSGKGHSTIEASHGLTAVQAEPSGTCDDIDPLVAASIRNRTESSLHRLPDSVLHRIITQLDVGDRGCLRQASRLFMRLLCTTETGPEAWKVYEAIGGPPGSMLPWPPAEASILTSRRMAQLQEQTRYCRGCQAARLAPDFQRRWQRASRFIHCFGCGMDHRSWMFAPEQRRENDDGGDGKRRCVLHQGHLRICDHETATLSEVIAEANAAAAKEPLVFKGPTVRIIRCAHEAHKTTGPRCTASRKERPGISVGRTPSGSLCAYLTWESHIRWGGDPATSEGSRPTASALRRQLASLRQSTGRFMVPDDYPRPATELRCIDPHRCACVRFPGSERFDWPLARKDQVRIRRQCRAAREADPAGWADKGLFQDGPDVMRHVSRSFWGDDRSGEPPRSVVSLGPCDGDPRCVIVTWDMVIPLQDPGARADVAADFPGADGGKTWHIVLDPDSYDATADHELLNLTWCRQEGCLNYYRSRRAMSRRSGHSRPCDRDCAQSGMGTIQRGC